MHSRGKFSSEIRTGYRAERLFFLLLLFYFIFFNSICHEYSSRDWLCITISNGESARAIFLFKRCRLTFRNTMTVCTEKPGKHFIFRENKASFCDKTKPHPEAGTQRIYIKPDENGMDSNFFGGKSVSNFSALKLPQKLMNMQIRWQRSRKKGCTMYGNWRECPLILLMPMY